MDEQEGSTGADRDAQTRFVAKVKIRYGSASPDGPEKCLWRCCARTNSSLLRPGGPPAPCIRLDALISTRSLILRFAVTREGWLHSHTSVFTRFIILDARCSPVLCRCSPAHSQ